MQNECVHGLDKDTHTIHITLQTSTLQLGKISTLFFAEQTFFLVRLSTAYFVTVFIKIKCVLLQENIISILTATTKKIFPFILATTYT